MPKYKITGIATKLNRGDHECFTGFVLEGVDALLGVDPFVSGELEHPEFSSNEEMIAWARDRVGQFLECDELLYTAHSAFGDVKILETAND